MAIGFEAYWVPGLSDGIEQEESLQAALEWLSAAEGRFHTTGRIVMYAKKMMGNDPILAEAAQRWEFVSRRSQPRAASGPVLCVWPPDLATLEFAEHLAAGTGLCVVRGHYDLGAWVERTVASCLLEGWTAPQEQTIPKETRRLLDGMIDFDGHNGFVGAGGKEDAIRTLRAIARSAASSISADELAEYLVTTGGASAEGVRRARKWYEEILAGRKHRDYRSRIIQ